jgi:hypothetical protein
MITTIITRKKVAKNKRYIQFLQQLQTKSETKMKMHLNTDRPNTYYANMHKREADQFRTIISKLRK